MSELIGKPCAAVRVLAHEQAGRDYLVNIGDTGEVKGIMPENPFQPWDCVHVAFPVKGTEVNFAVPVHLLEQYVEIRD
jgi:hypothetical protein